MVTKWQELDIEGKVIEILNDIRDAAPEHHLGRPFLTAYQIAVEFARRYPEDAKQLGLPIGGAGTGKHNSLAQYLALQLSRGIKAGRLAGIEGSLTSTRHLSDIRFDADGKVIHSSLTGSGSRLSMFRLRG